MRLHLVLLSVAVAALAGCATPYKVTLSRPPEVYVGTLTFDTPYTGELSIPKGPGGESFKGYYVAGDMASGARVTGGTSLKDELGFWTGEGTRGSSLSAEITVGRGRHGIGTATDWNGKEYTISF